MIIRYIHEGTVHPEIRKMASSYVTNDVIPCLVPSPIDLHKYLIFKIYSLLIKIDKFLFASDTEI